ncbi:MAG: aminotransferase class I and II, partial [Sphingobacteriaceae bacterium]
LIPADWLGDEDAEEHREVYYQFLTRRVAASDVFVKEVQRARA